MTPERFEQLADAWGADLRRWPAPERMPARGLLEREPRLRAVLARAAELDALLDAHTVAAPGAALVRGVLAAAPGPSRRGAQAPRIGWWWSGAGAAGLGLAGAAAGVLAVSMALTAAMPTSRPPAGDGGWAASAFDLGGPADWSDE